MKTYIQREKGSITLGMVYGLGLLSLGIASLALSSVVSNVSAHKNEMSGVSTFVTADSAAREGAYRLITQPGFTGSADGVDLNSVLGSTIVLDTSMWPFTSVVGDAQNALTDRKAVYTMRPSDIQLGFEHAIFSEQDVSLGGNAHAEGSVYAGGNITKTGAAGGVDGAAYVAGNVYNNTGHPFSTSLSEGVEQLVAPTIDPSPYKTSDPACHQTVPNNGKVTNAIKWNQCPSVYLIAPNTTNGINGGWPNQPWKGVLVIDGKATINGGTFSCAGTCSNPLAIYVDGTLTLSGNVEVTGLVYVTGSATVGNGTGSVTGSLVSDGGVSVIGNLGVEYNPVIMGNWQSIGGLDLSGGTDPTIVGWGEM